MSDYLLEREKESTSSYKSKKTGYPNSMDNEYGSSKENIFDFYNESNEIDNLSKIYTKSKLRRCLCKILAGLYSFPILIIILSFCIGMTLFGIPMLFIYFNILGNIIKPIIFILLFSIFFSIILIIIRIIDDKKTPKNIGAKWERKNILKNLGLSITLMILTVSAFFFHHFFDKIISKEGQLELINNSKKDENDYCCDFIMKYIIGCYLVEEERQYDNQIKESSDEILENLFDDLRISCIPLVIFGFNKIIKIIIIEVKYTFSNLLVFFNFFLLTVLIILFPYFSKSYRSIISIIEIILLSLIFLGYITWTICEIYKLFYNPKDKSFGINKYNCCQILFIFLFYLMNIFGSLWIYFSILFSYFAYINYNLQLILLKVGFLLLTISNSYYYGHHLLSLIFRPIALEYIPAPQKKYYKRAYSSFTGYCI